MSAKAKVLDRLYRKGRISAEGVRQALEDGIITEEEYKQIVAVL